MYTEEMFSETFALKREGMRGKKLARSMAERFSGYSAEELKVLAELVPSPELRARAKGLHYGLLALLGTGALLSASSAYTFFAAGDRTLQGLAFAVLVLLFRMVAIVMIARYRRDGAMLVIFGVAMGFVQLVSRMDFLSVAYAIALVVVAWLWLGKLFPNLTLRGQPRP